MASNHPHDAKQLGREVRNCDDKEWGRHRFDIVTRGHEAKFSQHAQLKDYLRGTGDRVLVEASPHDCIWKIGLEQNNPDVGNPTKWPGLNLLGFALKEVRERLFCARIA